MKFFFSHHNLSLTWKAYSPTGSFRIHHPHLSKLLLSILEVYPSSVISASCAGGPESVDEVFSSLLRFDVSVLVTLILHGCIENYTEEENKQQQQSFRVQQQDSNSSISRGLHRKFVRGLAEWGLFEQIVNCITTMDDEDKENTEQLDRESVCDALITIVRILGNPPATGKPNEPNSTEPNGDKDSDEVQFGEDTLMKTIGKQNIIEKAVACIAQNPYSSQGVASSRALLTLFELATGAKRRKKQGAQSINTETAEVGEEKKLIKNRLVRWGIGQSIYKSLCENITMLVNGIVTPSLEIDDNKNELDSETSLVFTSRRLNIITALAEMLEYGSLVDASESCGILETLDSIQINDSSNIWMYFNELLFLFPENDLYHIQYYRIFLAALRWNHEGTLRLFIQKSKFVTKAIKTLRNRKNTSSTPPPAPHGVLLKCLNALRLQCQSISSKSYLRHNLESHDVWKGFQDELIE